MSGYERNRFTPPKVSRYDIQDFDGFRQGDGLVFHAPVEIDAVTFLQMILLVSDLQDHLTLEYIQELLTFMGGLVQFVLIAVCLEIEGLHRLVFLRRGERIHGVALGGLDQLVDNRCVDIMRDILMVVLIEQERNLYPQRIGDLGKHTYRRHHLALLYLREVAFGEATEIGDLLLCSLLLQPGLLDVKSNLYLIHYTLSTSFA